MSMFKVIQSDRERLNAQIESGKGGLAVAVFRWPRNMGAGERFEGGNSRDDAIAGIGEVGRISGGCLLRQTGMLPTRLQSDNLRW